MANKTAKTVVASLIIVGALGCLFFSLHEFGPDFDPKPHEALGQVMAEEAAKLVESGGRVIVIARSTAIFRNPAADVQWQSFYRSIQKAKLIIAATNIFKINPILLVRVPPGDFVEILRRASESDVVVSFLGPPVLNAEQLGRLGEPRPKVLALCAGSMPSQINLKQLFQMRLLHVAIISRKNAALSSPPPTGPAGWFEQLYLVVTPANLADLPSPATDRS